MRSLRKTLEGCLIVGLLFGGPDSLHAAAAAVDGLTVNASVDANGNAVVGPMTVYLNGPLSVAIATSSLVLTFSPIPAGTYTVRTWIWGYCENVQTVTVSGSTTLMVLPSVACTDRIAPAVPDQTIAVISGRFPSASPACLVNQLRQGLTPLFLTQNMLPPTGSTCHNAVGLLSQSHAFWYSNDPAVLPWTIGTGDVLAPTLDVPLVVPMKIFVVSTGTTPVTDKIDQIRDFHLARAETLFSGSYAGVVLGASSGVGDPEIQDLTTNTALVAAVGHGCEKAAEIKTHPDLYDDGRLNVFYVDDVQPGSKAGLTCVAEGAPNIIFIHSTESGPYILVHEVGHALGLNRPNWGHTTNMSGFVVSSGGAVEYNVMGAWSELAGRYLSVGQVMQMHLSDGSWLNLPSAASGSTLRGRSMPGRTPVVDACRCPETEPGTECPPLNLDIARAISGSSLSGAPLHPQACWVTVTAPTATIGCALTTPVQVTASFFADAANTVLGWADAQWVSLTPTIVTATLDPTYTEHGKSRGLLNGVGSGTGIVKVWAGGSSATFSVNVSCP